MFPLRDDQPVFSTPYVNYFLIAFNIFITFLEWQLGWNSRAFRSLIFQYGVVPRHEIGLLTGVPIFSPVGALIPLFTSMFLHGGWAHVLGNMWMLWLFGDNIEDYLGHIGYIIFYLLSGIAAMLTHILFNANSSAPAIGASGAIAGVMGAYLILYPRARVLTWIFVLIVPIPAWIWLVIWAGEQFLSGAAESLSYAGQAAAGGVAFWAHVGGFVVGMLMIRLFPGRRHRYRYGTW
jgi:membrane associated rhomboid family serine protease